MKQTIRIIGGLYRGKKLHFPDQEGLRPTPDRVRETLFNWLMADIRGARCLDAYAGSGALGFEAYSRGASKIVLVEQALAAYQNLKKIAITFASPSLSVINADATEFMHKCKEQFDIIFLDPPFASNQIPSCLTLLAQSSVLVAGGLVYIESATEPMLAPEIWEQVKAKRAGQVYYGLYKKRTS